MRSDGFQYDFTVKELIYFLLKKKNCPRCNGPLVKRKNFEMLAGHELNSRSDAFFASNAKVKHYQYVYTCEQCHGEYTLHELAE